MRRRLVMPLLVAVAVMAANEIGFAASPFGPNTIRSSGNIIGEIQCNGLAAEGIFVQIPGYQFSSYTDSQGFYRFFHVPEGTYDLSAGLADQGKVVAPNVQVFANETVSIEIVDICAVAPPPPASANVLSGTYGLNNDILYVCGLPGIPVVEFNVSEFVFEVIGANLTITGAPVSMTGTVDGSDFQASGTIAGTANETYVLVGSFATADDWTGTFTITFTGDIGLTDCTNQQFGTESARVPPSGANASWGIYSLNQDIVYVCGLPGIPVVEVNMSELAFQVIGTSLIINGPPVSMVGTVDGFDFQASGTLAGSVDETYALTGSFATVDDWTGIFTISFIGDTNSTDCTNQQFDRDGARVP